MTPQQLVASGMAVRNHSLPAPLSRRLYAAVQARRQARCRY
jgi:hypothetical protein